MAEMAPTEKKSDKKIGQKGHRVREDKTRNVLLNFIVFNYVRKIYKVGAEIKPLNRFTKIETSLVNNRSKVINYGRPLKNNTFLCLSGLIKIKN